MNQPKDILFKYLGGECTPEELKQVEEWRDSDKENLHEFAAVKSLWDQAELPIEDFKPDVNAAWHKLNIRTLSEPQLQVYYQKNRRRNTPVWYMAAAAMLLIGAFIGYMVLFNWLKPEIEWEMISTGDGIKHQIELADGSTIWLNENSRLTYPKSFTENEREVKLEGEAFFEVEPDTRTFSILSSNTRTTVLGTAFNVSAYENADKVVVSVLSGKVAFESTTPQVESLDLEAGQRGVFSVSSGKISVKPIQSENFLAWQTGVLKYENQPFKEVIADLERFYKISIEVEGNFNKCFITTTFDNISIEEALQVLTMIIKNGRFSEADEGYKIRGKGC